jgi:5'-nucleotidase
MRNFYAVSLFIFIFFVGTCNKAQTDTLTILHLNDTHSNLAPAGPRTEDLKGTQYGIARAATIIGMNKMTEPNVLFLHAGDAYIGDLFFNVYFGAAEFKLLNAMGLDAMAVGNHEFDLQPSTLEQALISSFEPDQGFPLLCSNLILDDPAVDNLKNYISPYTIKEVGGLKIGIFGLTTPEANLLSLPAPAVIDTNIIETAAAMVETLAGENCDVIISLSHMGFALDQLVAEYVPGINVIVSGHDHYLLEEPVEVESPSGTTFIVQAGAYYSYVGKLKLVVENGEVSLLDYQSIPLDNSVPEEPSISSEVDALILGVEEVYGPVYTQQIAEASEYFEEAADPLNNGFIDTPVGNLVTDAFRERTGTDIAIQPGGLTAQPIYQGPLVAADAFRALGYGFNTFNGLGYRIVTFDILGAELLAGLEFGLADIELNDEFLIQVSGMSYDFVTSQPPYERLSTVLINGDPINPMASYSVTTNEFVLGVVTTLLGIAPANVVVFEELTEFQVLSEYITNRGVIHPDWGDRITDTRENNEGMAVPEAFVLEQNYPNPFNPSTTISFSIKENAFTELKIYNTLGEEIATLVSNKLSPGIYKYEWNAVNLASGIYLYSLRSGDYIQTKKLMLMK